MWVYILTNVEQASDSYHSGGSVVVVAEHRPHAKRLIAETPGVVVSEEDWKHVKFYLLDASADPKVFVFPDAGCC